MDWTYDTQWRCYLRPRSESTEDQDENQGQDQGGNQDGNEAVVRGGGTHLRLGRANEEAAEERL